MANVALKIPPPPPLAQMDPAFNRWLLELTKILSASGGIDPDAVEGLEATIAQVATNTADIAALQTASGNQSAFLILLFNQIALLQAQITTINGQLTTLGARSQVFNGVGAPGVGLGVDNDWYYNTAGGVGARLYIKLAGAWVAQAI